MSNYARRDSLITTLFFLTSNKQNNVTLRDTKPIAFVVANLVVVKRINIKLSNISRWNWKRRDAKDGKYLK